jgi:Protein of unknown function (DUF3307)
MQMLFRTLLAIYLAHLLADFVLQTDRLVERKRRRQFSGYLLHGLVHYISAVLIFGFFIPGSIFASRTHVVIAALVIVHLLIDLAKIEFTQQGVLLDGLLVFLADQCLHFATIVAAAWLLAPAVPAGSVGALLQKARSLPDAFLAIPVIYAAVVFGGGYLIRFLTHSLAESTGGHSPERTTEQLQNAGLYIGWLERFLVLTALLLQSPLTVGLLVTAKSIARYPEFKSERFAEYFLIGTLLSISMAVVGAAFLLKLLFGQVRFS